jgi:hypothetical protein
MEPLQSSGGQHGMSAWSAIDISTGFVEMAAPPVAGTMAREMAIKAVKIVRAKAMANYQAMWREGQRHSDGIDVIV